MFLILFKSPVKLKYWDQWEFERMEKVTDDSSSWLQFFGFYFARFFHVLALLLSFLWMDFWRWPTWLISSAAVKLACARLSCQGRYVPRGPCSAASKFPSPIIILSALPPWGCFLPSFLVLPPSGSFSSPPSTCLSTQTLSPVPILFFPLVLNLQF